MLKDLSNKKHHPITMNDIIEEERAEEQRKLEEAERPIKAAEAQLNETHRKLHSLEKDEILAGRPDPGWVLPPAAVGLNMSLDQALEFNRKTAEQFVAEHPEYYPTRKNEASLKDYLTAHKIGIATVHCWEQAFERLTAFGLLEARPQPALQPAPPEKSEVVEPEQQPYETFDDGGLSPGWDENGQPRNYTQREIHHMSSDQYKRAFKLWRTRDEDRRPLMRRSFYL
jgi:hypothetical protein